MEHADVRYLESKRSVDERARSERVRDRLLTDLQDAPAIVDVGAGTGATLHALLEWGVLEGSYLGIERSAHLVEYAREAVPAELAEDGFAVESSGDGFAVEGLAARFETGDVLALGEWDADLVVGQALLDVVPIVDAMDAIAGALRPGGLAYLPITFDGVTEFEPPLPDDGAVLGAYHGAIDGTPGRDTRAGSRLVDHLRGRPGDLLAVGRSDWTVEPRGGEYPAAEAHFLGCILDFVADALGDADVDAAEWLAERRRRLDAGGLTYRAKNYDVLYRTPTG